MRLNAARIYKSVQFSNFLQNANQSVCRRLDNRSARLVASFERGGPFRRSDIAKLTACSTTSALLDTVNGFPHLTAMESTLYLACIGANLVSPSAPPIRLLSQFSAPQGVLFGVAAASVGILLLCGSGRYGRYSSEKPIDPSYRSKMEHFFRYGILGAPEALMAHLANRFDSRGAHRLAATCYLGAAVCAVPLEIARTILFVGTCLGQMPKIAFWTCMFTTYSLVQHARTPKRLPQTYVPLAPFTSYGQTYDFPWAGTNERRKPFSGDVIDKQALQWSGNFAAKATREALSTAHGPLLASNAAEARHQLRQFVANDKHEFCGHLVNTDQFVQNIEVLRDFVGDVAKQKFTIFSLFGEQKYKDSLQLQFRNEARLRLWERRHFHRLLLALHPDKLDPQKTHLSEQERRLGAAIYGLAANLRELDITDVAAPVNRPTQPARVKRIELPPSAAPTSLGAASAS